MALNLTKGSSSQLSLRKLCVGLGWAVSDESVDLDVAAFLIGKNKKVLADDYVVFYNSNLRVRSNNLSQIVKASEWGNDNAKMRHESRPVDPDLSVIGSIDVDDEDENTSEGGDDETMDIDLNRVCPDVEEIIITVSIYDYESRRQNFGQVERAYVRIFKPENAAEGQEDYRYDLTEDFSTCTAVEFCRIYRHNGGWELQALGEGLRGGLDELVDKYV